MRFTVHRSADRMLKEGKTAFAGNAVALN